MLYSWERMMDIITQHSTNSNFLDVFNRAASNEKVAVCLLDDFARCLFYNYCVRSNTLLSLTMYIVLYF